MTTHQIQLVKESWALVEPSGKAAGALFYRHLFEMAPQVRHLFGENLEAQQGKLIRMLQYIVSNIDQLHQIAKEVQDLGRRHYHYHALPHHYELIGSALFKTLQVATKDAWTPEVENAWRTAFNTLRNMMIIAQESERTLYDENATGT